MAYLGRGLDKISNIEVLDNITFDGSSSYSITKGSVAFTPNSAQSCLISIDGVVQATNFTVSSSTIDFGVAVASTSICNFFLHYGTGVMTVPSDGSVTTAKLGDSAVSLAKLTATGTKDATTFLRGDNSFSTLPASGITEADIFRITAAFSASADPVSSNWERVDDASFSKIGTGMSVSSGIWSFPTTGLYKVQFNIHGHAYNTTINNELWTTINNSTYTREAIGRGGDADGYYFNVEIHTFVNVTDTSNVKVKARVDAGGTWSVYGNTDQNETYLTFIRLGDSQ